MYFYMPNCNMRSIRVSWCLLPYSAIGNADNDAPAAHIAFGKCNVTVVRMDDFSGDGKSQPLSFTRGIGAHTAFQQAAGRVVAKARTVVIDSNVERAVLPESVNDNPVVTVFGGIVHQRTQQFGQVAFIDGG